MLFKAVKICAFDLKQRIVLPALTRLPVIRCQKNLVDF